MPANTSFHSAGVFGCLSVIYFTVNLLIKPLLPNLKLLFLRMNIPVNASISTSGLIGSNLSSSSRVLLINLIAVLIFCNLIEYLLYTCVASSL